jgi:Mrp family chromosome partitioning ATPase
MAQLIQPSVGRSSSLLNLSLSWNDPEEGATIVNQLMSIFIEDMATQRKAIQKDHLQHLDMQLMQASAHLDDARDRRNALTAQQQKQLEKGGETSEKYRNARASMDNAEAELETKKTEISGVQEQIQALTKTLADVDKRQLALETTQKQDILHEVSDAFTTASGRYTPSSAPARQLNDTVARITQYAKSADPTLSFERWQKDVAKIFESKATGLPDAELKKLFASLQRIQADNTPKFTSINSERQRLQDQRSQLQLRMIPLSKEVIMYQQRRDALLKQANVITEQITGISANQLDEAKTAVEEAEKRLSNLRADRETLNQLAESRLREWTVSIPASPETTEIGSNRAKLFVLAFAFCCFAFSAPLLVAEWHTQTGTPQVQFARSLRMPILAERILDDFSPRQRRANANERFIAEQMETLRMLTLRIQQSCHRPGSVVLFSSLDPKFSAAPVMAMVAECLADREERVLLIDAVSPDRSLLSLLNVSTNGKSAPPVAGKKDKAAKLAIPHDPSASAEPGLSEYLAENCEDVGELIRPTGCPGVDMIPSGRMSFAREAMASSCLTQLLSTCRKNYTMVLVNGPTIDCTADIQMLTARADGIVLTATKKIGKNARVKEIVQELMDLGAPIIGLVA